MTSEINPNLAMSMARQFGITIMHNEAENLVQLLKSMHREGFKNGAFFEREACIQICENFADQDSGPEGILIDYHAFLIRARGEA